MRKDKIVSEVLGEENTITPSDLYNTDFRNALFGGYMKAEVDAFLERMGDAFEALIQEVREVKEHNDALKEELEAFREIEQSLRDALASSQRFSEDVLDAARREAGALRQEAQLVGARAEQQARELATAMRDEVRSLEAERSRLRSDMAAVLQAHAHLLDTIPRAEEAAVDPLGSVGPGATPETEGTVAGRITLDREPWNHDEAREEDPT